jgi:hypothetical protein
MKYFCLILLMGIFLSYPFESKAQAQQLTIEDAFILAEERSLEAVNARNVFLYAYWQYRNYRAELLPNVVLEGDFPSLNRSLGSYLKENGTYGFVKNNSISEDLTLSISQNIPFSGGNISVQSALQRIDQLGNDKTTGYLSIPFSFTLYQPLFGPKTLKWAMRIEPERYKEAKQQYQADLENVYMKTINYYFDLLLAQTNLDIARINQINAAKLYDIATGEKSIGLISNNDLLQLELNKINFELKHYKVAAEISDSSGNKVFSGNKVIVKTANRELTGTVENIIPSVKNGVINFAVLLNNNENEMLRSGHKVDIYLINAIRKDVLQITNRSCYKGEEEYDLWVIKDNEAVKK